MQTDRQTNNKRISALEDKHCPKGIHFNNNGKLHGKTTFGNGGRISIRPFLARWSIDNDL